jgi:hypothetical protein
MRASVAQPRQKRPGLLRLTGVGLQASDLSPENASTKKAQVGIDRADCDRRPRHAKRTKDDIIGIGTWNIQTLKPGRMLEIADQIKNKLKF